MASITIRSRICNRDIKRCGSEVLQLYVWTIYNSFDLLVKCQKPQAVHLYA